MKIEVTATDEWGLGTQEQAEAFIKRFSALKKYCASIERIDYTNNKSGKPQTITHYEVFIELNTLEELVELQKAINEEFVLKYRDGRVGLEIYNDYRE